MQNSNFFFFFGFIFYFKRLYSVCLQGDTKGSLRGGDPSAKREAVQAGPNQNTQV